jgi:diadenosine tetraphosphate (Ap4A) HIT family hydrolase
MTCELCEQTGGKLLWRDSACRVVRVEEPGYPGYCRVIWNTHVREMTDLAPEERAHFMRVVFAAESVLRKLMKPHKVNLASLGNMTPHLHWHVIARDVDDPHFPQPVWGEKQREAALATQPGIDAQLAAALAAELAREGPQFRREM